MNRLIPILITIFLLFTVHWSFPQGIWKTYTRADGLAGDTVRCITQDKFGNYWIGTRGAGLSKLDTNGVWTNFMNTDSTVFILDIEIDSLNNKWLAVQQRGGVLFGSYVVKFDDSTFTYYCPQGDPYYSLISPISMGQDSLGHIWCGTVQIAYWFDGRDWHPWHVAGTGMVSKINEIKTDRRGKLYFAHDRGIATLAEYIYQWGTNDMAFDKHNCMWFGGLYNNQGLGMFDGQNWYFYTSKDGLLIDNLYDVAVDSNNNVWLANGTAWGIYYGVSKFNGHTFTHFNHNDGLADDIIWDIFVDSKSNIWFATYKGVTVLHDTTSTTIKKIDAINSYANTFSLFQNYPNPFNSNTLINYNLGYSSNIELAIYNLNGKEVIKLVNEKQSSGEHQIIWNGKDNNGKEVNSGIYLAVLKSDDLKKVIKLTLIR